MASPSVLCKKHGCTRRVRRDNPTFPYCKDHRIHAERAEEVRVFGSLPTVELELARPRPLVRRDDHTEHSVDMVTSFTNISPDLAEPLLKTHSEWAGDDDLTVPSNALARVGDAAKSLRGDLVSSGVDADRVTIREYQGLHRMTRKWREQHYAGMSHEVVVLDKGTPNEVVVDPIISAFAPLPQSARDQDVDEVMESGITPFGESPWIGSSSEYESSGYLWWDSNSDN